MKSRTAGTAERITAATAPAAISSKAWRVTSGRVGSSFTGQTVTDGTAGV